MAETRIIKCGLGKDIKIVPFTNAWGLYSAQIQIVAEVEEDDSYVDFTSIEQIDNLIDALEEVKKTWQL